MRDVGLLLSSEDVAPGAGTSAGRVRVGSLEPDSTALASAPGPTIALAAPPGCTIFGPELAASAFLTMPSSNPDTSAVVRTGEAMPVCVTVCGAVLCWFSRANVELGVLLAMLPEAAALS